MKDERKTKAELVRELRQLRKSEEKDLLLSSDAIASMEIGILVLDSRFRIVRINGAMEQYFGLCRKEVEGKDKREVIDRLAGQLFEDPDTFSAVLQEAYQSVSSLERFECHVLPGGGRSDRWLELWSHPLSSGDLAGGRIEYCYDITARKRAERAMREKEHLLRMIVSSTKDAMISINDSGLITLFNPAAEKMFGRSMEEMLGQPLDALMPKKYRAAHRKYVKSYFASGRPDSAVGKTVELPGQRADGTEFPMEISLSPGRVESGSFVIAVLRDITERKQAERELGKRTDELKAEREQLTEKNIALKQVLDHIEKEKRDFKQQICRDVEQAVVPVLKNLKTGAGSGNAKKLEILEEGIKIILERDQDDFMERLSSLTPRELEICQLIKEGKSSKQISSSMNISLGTVQKHREKVRKKLGITNKAINLGSILQTKR